MLERELRDGVAFVHVAHHTDEGRDGADPGIGCAQPCDLTAGIEILVLYANLVHA
jgi:hypothetical protein